MFVFYFDDKNTTIFYWKVLLKKALKSFRKNEFRSFKMNQSSGFKNDPSLVGQSTINIGSEMESLIE